MAINYERESKKALGAALLELKQMHSHYQPKCDGGCPTLDAIERVEKALNLHIVHVVARRWFDSRAGNTYHSVRCYFEDGTESIAPYQYGYGSAYEDTAFGLILEKFSIERPSKQPVLWQWYEENGFVINYSLQDVKRKKEL